MKGGQKFDMQKQRRGSMCFARIKEHGMSRQINALVQHPAPPILFLFFMVLELEPRVWCMIDRCFTTELHHQPPTFNSCRVDFIFYSSYNKFIWHVFFFLWLFSLSRITLIFIDAIVFTPFCCIVWRYLNLFIHSPIDALLS